MESVDVYTLITTILTLICGGGWFVNWRAKKRKETAEARQSELNATITEQDMYQEMLKDVEDHNERLRRFNTEISVECEQLRKRVSENENKLREQDDKIREYDKKLRQQESKIESLETNNTKIVNLQMESNWLSMRTIIERSPDRAPYDKKRQVKDDTYDHITERNRPYQNV